MSQTYGKVTPEVLNELEEIVGPNNLVHDDKDALENYSYDEAGRNFAHMPEVVLKCETTEQISLVMKIADERRIPVTVSAARSGIAGAAVPLCGGIVISTEKMNRILEIDKVNRVAVVEPGVVTNDLCKAVLEEGLLYAGYPMSTLTSFIGGNVSTNAGGGKVIRYGNTRRHIMGLEVVLANGEILNLGGKTRKSTWGYDLMQLIIGSEGTLAIVTKVIVNLEPLPGKTVDLLVPFADIDTAVQTVAKIISSGVPIISCEYIDKLAIELTTKYLNTSIAFQDKAEAFLIIQVEGKSEEQLENNYEKVGGICYDNDALEVFVADNRTASENIWNVRQNFAEGIRAADPYASLSGDVVVPLSAVPEMMDKIENIGSKYDVVIVSCAHIADGNLHPELLKPDRISLEDWPEYAEKVYAEMTEAAIGLGGVGSGEHGVGFLKMPILLDTKKKVEIEIMKGVKRAFDPNWILNPGKLLGTVE